MANTYTYSYRDVKASRAIDTYYENTTDEDLFVVINVAGRGTQIDILLPNNTTLVLTSGGSVAQDLNDRHNFSFVVPPKHKYRLRPVYAISSWTEMSIFDSFSLPLCLSEIASELGISHNAGSKFCMGRTESRNLAGIPSGRLCLSNFLVSPLTITTNQKELNLRTWALANGWNGTSAATITVASGVYIWSDNTAVAGLTTGAPWPSGVTLVNNGFIIGKGGNGGNFGSGLGAPGGPAISLGVNCTITNNSGAFIAGGGGGGGSVGGGGGAGGGAGGTGNLVPNSGGQGGAVGSSGVSGSGGRLVAGGQGGGAGGGAGGFAEERSPPGRIFYPAGQGGGGGRILPGSGGAGGTGTFANGGVGGSGGAAGSAGGSGAAGGGGGWGAAGAAGSLASGAGGPAISKNGYTVTISGAGIIYGAIN
jgi:hypothetical protein